MVPGGRRLRERALFLLQCAVQGSSVQTGEGAAVIPRPATRGGDAPPAPGMAEYAAATPSGVPAPN
eukprot:6112701-Prorocentrum_lima.AAC.1